MNVSRTDGLYVKAPRFLLPPCSFSGYPLRLDFKSTKSPPHDSTSLEVFVT